MRLREDFWREYDVGESDRDLRDNGDAGDPLRPDHHDLDNITRSGDRYRFRERPVKAGAAGS